MFLIYGVFFIALFGGLLSSLGIPTHFFALPELCIILLFVISPLIGPARRIHVFSLLPFFLLMLLITVCSVLINHSGSLRSLFSLRLLYRYYFFYLAIITASPSETQIRQINTFLAVLLLLQFPVVAVKFFSYGINEKTMGAYEHSGALATILPISIIFYCAGYYFLYHPDRRYIFVAIGFVVCSIVGAKRAVAFLYPLQFLAIYYFIYIKSKMMILPQKVISFLLVLGLAMAVTATIFSLNQSLNPEGQVKGTVDAEYALDYAKSYTTHENPYGYTTGRYSTTKRIFGMLWNLGFDKLFFGIGPGAATGSLFDSDHARMNVLKVYEQFKISYGFTSMNMIALEYGLLGVFAYSLMLFMLARMSWKYYQVERDPYWRAFAAGSFGFAYSMLFFYFTYQKSAFWGDTLPPLYFYAMAVVYTRLQRISGPASPIRRFAKPR